MATSYCQGLGRSPSTISRELSRNLAPITTVRLTPTQQPGVVRIDLNLVSYWSIAIWCGSLPPSCVSNGLLNR
ncbi:hypothetical protein [Herbaspirillum seropedicae]|uniref:hypothetical protein n=1 Tax=Herbaspirillum seropedicae TaxID=964 RepID=UPI0035B54532